VTRDAIAAVEQDGIVFIDEIDKIVSSAETRLGADFMASTGSDNRQWHAEASLIGLSTHLREHN
jgi:hypothetical protein